MLPEKIIVTPKSAHPAMGKINKNQIVDFFIIPPNF
jgi:hypothetical protein